MLKNYQILEVPKGGSVKRILSWIIRESSPRRHKTNTTYSRKDQTRSNRNLDECDLTIRDDLEFREIMK